MTMLIIFGYALPAVVFFCLNCWDVIDCCGELTLADIWWGILAAVIPVINWGAFFSILDHLNNKHDLVSLNFVIYRRKK